MADTPDTEFTTRVLCGMRTDIQMLTETAARLSVEFEALAKEHGITPIQPEQVEATVDSGMNADINVMQADFCKQHGLVQ